MLLKRIAVVIGALAVSSLAAPATVSGGQMIERDFHATYAGEYQSPDLVTHECGAGEIANLVLGEGVGSLVGRSAVRIEACLDPSVGLVTGTAYWTAANGDLLAFEFAGYAVPQPDGSVVSHLPADEAFGTGRFADVEVIGGDGAVDTTIGTSSFGYVDGRIAYDASGRSR